MTVELSYLAGILEVSGSLNCCERKNRNGMRVVLQICHNERTIPDLFSKRFGGAVTFTRVRGKHRWTWTKQGKAAQAVLRELRPLIHYRTRAVDRILGLTIRNKGGVRYLPEPGKTVGAELRRVAG